MTDLSRLYDTLSSRHWSFVYSSPEECPASLLDALLIGLPHIDCRSWPERLAWGGVFINGRAARADRPLSAPCRVEYFEPKFDIASAADYFPKFRPEYVLHLDEDLIVAFKPANLPCLPGREQAHFNLKRCLREHCESEAQRGSIHLPSRLDAAVSGVIAASRSARMNKVLQQAFEKRTVSKTYLLEVKGAFPGEPQTVSQPIGRDPRHPVLRAVNAENGQPATTVFDLVCASTSTSADGVAQETSIVRARPLTGRTHQIRVHAAHLGFPIVGDNFYAGLEAEGLHLLSYAIGFFHPFRKCELRVQLPQPLCPPWALPAAERRLL